MKMEKIFSNLEELTGLVKDYADTRIESFKLNAAEKSSNVIANGIARLVVAIMFFFFFVFTGIAVSIVLGEWIGKIWTGFIIVAGFFLIAGLIIWYAKGKLVRVPVMNAMIQQLFKNDEEDKEYKTTESRKETD